MRKRFILQKFAQNIYMKISIHQPAYLPWLGYFDRIASSDVFVFLDTVQFEKNSFTNRNLIKSANGPIWLTIPVLQRNHFQKRLNEIQIDVTQNWRQKHIRSIEINYRKTLFFDARFEKLIRLYDSEYAFLADFCYDHLIFWLDELNIKTPVIRASKLNIMGQNSNLILALCQHLKATTYISGPLGRDYINEPSFKELGVDIIYQDYIHPNYEQLYPPFLPAMGVVDFWMNCKDYKYLS